MSLLSLHEVNVNILFRITITMAAKYQDSIVLFVSIPSVHFSHSVDATSFHLTGRFPHSIVGRGFSSQSFGW